jgi:heptaprenyl diphosphate synthase
MGLHDNNTDMHETVEKTLWILIALSLSAIEMLLPRIPFLPWLKPGLANCVTLLWIIRYGTVDAVLFSFLRTWIISFYFGFSFITFMLSTGGGVVATLIMGICLNLSRNNKVFGTIGISMLGAAAHNITQIFVIYFTMAQNSFIFYQLPFMCGASLVFGLMIGLLAPSLLSIIDIRDKLLSTETGSPSLQSIVPKKAASFAGFVFFIFCFCIILIKSSTILIFTAIGISICVQLICGISLRKFLYPLKFWLFFLFISIIYLFFSYGKKINGIPFITIEGLIETGNQFLRLWFWLQTSQLLTHFRFHSFFFSLLSRAFPSSASIFNASLLALEIFPDVLNFSRSKDTFRNLNFLKHPFISIKEYIDRHKKMIIDKLTNYSNG